MMISGISPEKQAASTRVLHQQIQSHRSGNSVVTAKALVNEFSREILGDLNGFNIEKMPVKWGPIKFGSDDKLRLAQTMALVNQLPQPVPSWYRMAVKVAHKAQQSEVAPLHLAYAVVFLAYSALQAIEEDPSLLSKPANAITDPYHKAFRQGLDALIAPDERAGMTLDQLSMVVGTAMINLHNRVYQMKEPLAELTTNLYPMNHNLFNFVQSVVNTHEAQEQPLVLSRFMDYFRAPVTSGLPSLTQADQDVAQALRDVLVNATKAPKKPPEPTKPVAAKPKQTKKKGGEEDTSPQAVFERLSEKLEELKNLPEEQRVLTDEQYDEITKRLERLRRTNQNSAEYGVLDKQLDILVNQLPWIRTAKQKIDINEVEKILNEDHHGLEKVKKRIMEYMAVLSYMQEQGMKPNGMILCLVGPPGVGKTSIAKSIAKASGRNFHRIALGGVRDEASIRGHRSTYVGAIPGRIVEGYIRARSNDPVLLLDEIDKLGKDNYQGDPTAALLEVLDPEQNKAFTDHYLNMEYDLSKTMFLATANYPDRIPEPLMDRMEIIELSGYDTDEKVEIALRHLVKEAVEKHGLKPTDLPLSRETLHALCENYTREPGVRQLKQKVFQIARQVVYNKGKGDQSPPNIRPDNLETWIGKSPHRPDRVQPSQLGRVNGLFWSMRGGGIMPILVSTRMMASKGESDFRLQNPTGNLEKVMQESIQTAFAYVDTHAKDLGITVPENTMVKVYIGTEEGAVPKDGPSAGAAFTTALVSALTGRKIRGDVAMTGTISLHGKVGRIGGVREKLSGAVEAGAKVVLLPKDNASDLEEVPDKIKSKLEKIILVDRIEDVLAQALEPAEALAAKEPVPQTPPKFSGGLTSRLHVVA